MQVDYDLNNTQYRDSNYYEVIKRYKFAEPESYWKLKKIKYTYDKDGELLESFSWENKGVLPEVREQDEGTCYAVAAVNTVILT